MEQEKSQKKSQEKIFAEEKGILELRNLEEKKAKNSSTEEITELKCEIEGLRRELDTQILNSNIAAITITSEGIEKSGMATQMELYVQEVQKLTVERDALQEVRYT